MSRLKKFLKEREKRKKIREEQELKEIQLEASASINIDDLQTVCLALGPYRNLTTLTASILFLHPNCQVLNHAGARILSDPRLNFLLGYSNEKFDRFARFAIHISDSGKKAQYGGSITLSHAFKQQYAIGELFKSTGMGLVKEDIKCLFWKESLRTTNCIRENSVDLDTLFGRNDKLRFLMPVRHPVDCAASNLKTGHVDLFASLGQGENVGSVLENILDEFLWFEQLRQVWPGRFFRFFSHDFNHQTIAELAAFLKLPPDEAWYDRALTAFNIRSDYRHSEELMSFYRDCVRRKFGAYPDFAEGLLRYAEPFSG
jgi:hypothetical protein